MIRSDFLISKCLFWYLKFQSQKTNEKVQIYYYGTSSRIVYVHFLGELKTPKRHFEIKLFQKISTYFFGFTKQKAVHHTALPFPNQEFAWIFKVKKI